jgi:hypothetical protein
MCIRKIIILVIDITVLFLIASFTCRKLLFESGFPLGNDVLEFVMSQKNYLELIRKHLMIPAWNPYEFCGYYDVTFICLNPIWIMIELILELIFQDYLLVAKVGIFVIFFLAGASMFYLTYYFTGSRVAAFTAGLTYMYSQFFLAIIGCYGQVYGAFGYATFPLFLLGLDIILNSTSIRKVMISALILSIPLSSHYSYVIIMAFFAVLYILGRIFLDKAREVAIKKIGINIFFISIIEILLFAFWILPVFIESKPFILNIQYPIEETFLGGWYIDSVFNAITLRVTCELEYSGLIYTLILVSAITLISLKIKSSLNYILLLTGLFFAFISVSPNYMPLYQWLYFHIPGFSSIVGRYSARALMVTCLCWAYFVGVFIDIAYSFIIRRVKQKLSRRSGSLLKFFTVLVFALIILLNSCNVYLARAPARASSIEGLGTYQWPNSYIQPYEWIKMQMGDFRVLTIPYGALIVSYPWIPFSADFGACSWGFTGKPVLCGFDWAYASPETFDFLTFIYSVTSQERTNKLLKLLGLTNVKYIVLQPLHTINKDFYLNQEDMRIAYQYDDACVIENLDNYGHFFVAQYAALVVGGRNVLLSLSEIPDFRLDQWCLIYVNQITKNNLNLLNTSNLIIFQNDAFLDYVFRIYAYPYLIELGKYGFSTYDSGKYWVKTNWRIEITPTRSYRQGRLHACEYLIFGEDLLTTSNLTLVNVPFVTNIDGLYDIWIRLEYGSKRGGMSIYVDNNYVKTLKPETASHFGGFKWVHVAEVNLKSGRHNLRILNDGSGTNTVDVAAILPSNVFKLAFQSALTEFQRSNVRLVYVIEPEEFFIQQNQSINWAVSRFYGCFASGGYTLCTTSPMINKAWETLFIPKSGEYQIAIRIAKGPDYGYMIFKIDDESFEVNARSDVYGFEWLHLTPIHLDVGFHKLEIEGLGRFDFDTLVIYSLISNSEKQKPPTINQIFKISNISEPHLTYTMINPSEYLVRLETNQPCFLIFSEAYHPLWKAYIGNNEVKHLISYSFLNAFYVEKIGRFEIKVRFLGQTYVNIGTGIAIVTFVGIIMYLILSKPRGGKNRINSTYTYR